MSVYDKAVVLACADENNVEVVVLLSDRALLIGVLKSIMARGKTRMSPYDKHIASRVCTMFKYIADTDPKMPCEVMRQFVQWLS